MISGLFMSIHDAINSSNEVFRAIKIGEDLDVNSKIQAALRMSTV